MNKNAIFTILDNKFVSNFLFSLWSLKKFNNLNCVDILVVSKERINKKNKNKILSIYNSVKFIQIKNYLNHNWPFDYDLKLHAYFIKKYDSLLYFDADVLFLNNFLDIFKYTCNFGAISYGDYFSATIMLFGKKERLYKNFKKFRNIFLHNKNSLHDQDIFNLMYKDKYYKIPYDYNQIFTNYNINTCKCLQFPGSVKGLDLQMETNLLLKNQTPLQNRLHSYLQFRKIKKLFKKEIINV